MIPINRRIVIISALCSAIFFAAGYWGPALFSVSSPVVSTTPDLNDTIVQTSAAPQPVADANIFINLAKKVVPSVVSISTISTMRSGPGYGGPGGPGGDPFRDFWDFFFRGPHGGVPDDGGGEEEEDSAPMPRAPKRPLPKTTSLGSGFIIDSAGLILTNNHVVAGADKIKVLFTEERDEKPTDGEVVGRDPELDLALIKVKTTRKLAPLDFGDSDSLEVGEYVMAVGNPFGRGHTVTHGIISAKGRDMPEFPLARYLQTDAPINPGNSGGPLVNLKGEVIGINNAIDARAQGIGFAIPSTLVRKVIPELKSKGTVSRGYIGVLVEPLIPEIADKIGAPKDLTAPFVSHVFPKEPADKAGVKIYDVVKEFNGKKITTPSELIGEVTSVSIGDKVPLNVLRSGKEVSLTIQVSKRPSAETVAVQKPPKKKSDLDVGMELKDLNVQVRKNFGLPPSSKGVLVAELGYGGPAVRAGLLRGDLILEVDRKPVDNVSKFFAIVKEKKSYLLRVERMDPSGRSAFMVLVLNLKEDAEDSE